MKSIKIFLASSYELEADRKELEIFIARKNKVLEKKGVFLKLFVWENFRVLLSHNRQQNEFHKNLEESDISVMLFGIELDKYSDLLFEEFRQFKETNKQTFIYFKDSDYFRFHSHKLEDFLHYKNMKDLKSHFNNQLDKLAESNFKHNIHDSNDNEDITDTYKRREERDTELTEEMQWRKILYTNKPKKVDIEDEVNCTVYAPKEVLPGNQFLVQVYAHTDEQTTRLEELAKSADESSIFRAATILDEKLPRKSRIDFNLILTGFVIDTPVLSIKWNGKIAAVQFDVKTPPEFPPSNIIGIVIVAMSSVPIGQLKFKMKVIYINSKLIPLETERDWTTMIRFQLAFISYASEDRSEVLKRVQMLNVVRLKFFQDLLTLESGQKWEKQIYDNISRCDVFFLFWSKAASKSKWVKREIMYALKLKEENDDSLPEIVPVIIDGPPPAKPPTELKFLHFNDKFMYFINAGTN